MKQIKIGKHKLVIYDSIDELPMKRFHKFNKMMLIDSGIGSTLADFDNHLQKITAYIAKKDYSPVLTELDNLRQNVYMTLSGVSPKHLSFAVLVKKIDGKECEDISDDALQRIVDTLGDTPINEIAAPFEVAKKKIDEELREYFPNVFDDATIKEYYDRLKKRTLIILDCIINGKTAEKSNEIDAITLDLLTYSAPHKFSGNENTEILYDKQFEKMCLTISQNLHTEPKKYTVLEYYNAFEYIKEMARERAKSLKK